MIDYFLKVWLNSCHSVSDEWGLTFINERIMGKKGKL